MVKNYIANKKEFKNYMLGVLKDLHDIINFNPMTKDEERVMQLYGDLMDFVCRDDSREFSRSSFDYKGVTHTTIKLHNFYTADGCKVDYGVFTDEDFMNLNDDSLQYRMIDEKIYGYLPRKFIEKGTEQEVREYIKWNIG